MFLRVDEGPSLNGRLRKVLDESLKPKLERDGVVFLPGAVLSSASLWTLS